VRARDIVRMNPEVGPAAIEREQRRRQAKINIELSDRPLGDVTADVDKVMQGITMPPNFEWGFAGDVEMMQEAGAAMGLALVLAMAFIYIVLASQFESFLEPFLIMTSLPLALVGALLALLVHGPPHRHARDDRRGHVDGPRHQERDPARRPHESIRA
jgi:HAE1 family hydrophobic/amphiphilic exporter-1